MTAPVLFDYSGQQVRTVLFDGEPWFVAADVCDVLGIQNARRAVSEQVDEDGVRTEYVTDSLGRDQLAYLVSEAGLYELIFQSRKPEARDFRRWVTREVLPAIRRTGSFGQVALPSAKQLAHMVIEAETAREVAEAKVLELEPKAEIADRLLDAEGDLSVADAAKALTRGGLKLGAGRLFTILAERDWIYRAIGDQRWRVYQTAIESGYMSVLPQSHYHPRSGVLVLDAPQPRVTPKGLQKLLHELGALESA